MPKQINLIFTSTVCTGNWKKKNTTSLSVTVDEVKHEARDVCLSLPVKVSPSMFFQYLGLNQISWGWRWYQFPKSPPSSTLSTYLYKSSCCQHGEKKLKVSTYVELKKTTLNFLYLFQNHHLILAICKLRKTFFGAEHNNLKHLKTTHFY